MSTNSKKTIIVLSTCLALQMTSFVMILPLFARRFTELGAGVEALGISEMAFSLAGILTAPFMGALADRFGKKPVVLVSLVAFAMAFCGYLLAQSAVVIIVIRGLAGAFTAGLIPAVTALAVDVAPKDRQAQWIGFLNAGAAFGWIGGPVAGGILYDHWGYSVALVVSIGMAVLTLLVALLGVPKGHRVAERSQENDGQRPPESQLKIGGGFLRSLRSTLPRSLSAFIALLFIFFAVLFTWAFIEPRFMFYTYNDLGWSSTMLGLVVSTYGIAMMVGELAFGRLSDRVGRKPVILLGLLLFSAQFIGLAFLRNYMLIAVTFIVSGMGNALYDPALSASILDISPVEHRSRILGIKGMIGSCGSILGPALITLLNSSIDARSVFLISAGVVLLAILAAAAYRSQKVATKGIPNPDDVAASEISAEVLTIETNA